MTGRNERDAGRRAAPRRGAALFLGVLLGVLLGAAAMGAGDGRAQSLIVLDDPTAIDPALLKDALERAEEEEEEALDAGWHPAERDAEPRSTQGRRIVAGTAWRVDDDFGAGSHPGERERDLYNFGVQVTIPRGGR